MTSVSAAAEVRPKWDAGVRAPMHEYAVPDLQAQHDTGPACMGRCTWQIIGNSSFAGDWFTVAMEHIRGVGRLQW